MDYGNKDQIDKMKADQAGISLEEYRRLANPDQATLDEGTKARQGALQSMKDFGAGGRKGLTLGADEELSGAMGSGMDWLSEKMTGSSPTLINRKLKEQGFKGDVGPTDRSQLYRQIADQEQASNEQARQRSPKAYMGGELAGNLATTVAMGGAGAGSVAKGTLGQIAKQQGLKALAKESTKRALAAELPMMAAGGIESASESKNNLVGSSPEEKIALAKESGKGFLSGGTPGFAYNMGKMAMGSSDKEYTEVDLDSLTDDELRQLQASYK